MVLFDATILLPLLSPDVPPPRDPKTGEPVRHVKERLDHLVAQLEREKTKIVIPTPALSEILVHAGKAGRDYLETLSTSAAFRIAPFDVRAAVEVAAMTQNALASGAKRGRSTETWVKVKYDRQIVAIAKTERVNTIYSDDGHIRTLAVEAGIVIIGIAELPLPPDAAQGSLPFVAPEPPATPTPGE